MWNNDHEYVTLSVSLSLLTLPSPPVSASDKTSVKTINVSKLNKNYDCTVSNSVLLGVYIHHKINHQCNYLHKN